MTKTGGSSGSVFRQSKSVTIESASFLIKYKGGQNHWYPSVEERKNPQCSLNQLQIPKGNN